MYHIGGGSAYLVELNALAIDIAIDAHLKFELDVPSWSCAVFFQLKFLECQNQCYLTRIRGSTRLNIRQQIFREILFEANRLDGTAAGYTTGISGFLSFVFDAGYVVHRPFQSPIGCLQIQLIVWNLGAQGRTSGQQKEGDQPSIGSVNSHLDPLKGRKVRD